VAKDSIARALASGAGAEARQISSPSTVSISGNATLTEAQASYGALRFTGALAADATITLPAASQVQSLRNDCTGSGALWVRRGSSGNPLLIPQNETVEVR